MKRSYQGFIFRVRLSRRWLSLWFLGLFPLGAVRLSKISTISQGTRGEYWQGGFHRFFCPWRYWVWPGKPRTRELKPGLFILETETGTKIWVMLRSGLHYQLRDGVHRNRIDASEGAVTIYRQGTADLR